MKLTVDHIAQVLNVPASAIIEAMEGLGFKADENQLLTEKEVKKLRPLLFRYYQRSRAFGPEKVSDVKDSDIQDDIKQPVPVEGSLEQLILDHVIMIDTCSMMHEGCDALIREMYPILKKYNKKVVIPYKVIEELKKHYHSRNDPCKADLAERGLEICQKLKSEDCITIRGNENDNFADNVFFVHFADLRFRYNMLLITQDYKLSQDILQLNHMKTGGGNPVRVFRIAARGSLVEITE